MKKANSICPGCSVGCNITVEYKEDGIYRLKPRFHADVNQYWMCDDGRLGYHYVNSEERLQLPMKRVGDELVSTSWADALDIISEKLSATEAESIAVVGSAQGTNEENYLLGKLARDVLKTDRIGLFGSHVLDRSDEQYRDRDVAVAHLGCRGNCR